MLDKGYNLTKSCSTPEQLETKCKKWKEERWRKCLSLCWHVEFRLILFLSPVFTSFTCLTTKDKQSRTLDIPTSYYRSDSSEYIKYGFDKFSNRSSFSEIPAKTWKKEMMMLKILKIHIFIWKACSSLDWPKSDSKLKGPKSGSIMDHSVKAMNSHRKVAFSRLFNRHRFENSELECLFWRYILWVQHASITSAVASLRISTSTMSATPALSFAQPFLL